MKLPTPSLDLLKAAKIACIQRDTTLRQFLIGKGLDDRNARSVLMGRQQGPKAREIFALLVADLGLGEA